MGFGGIKYQLLNKWKIICQDLRIYKGVAKYTSNFLVASTNPDILPDTPSGAATKTALTKITNGAVAFDGTGDYLSTTGQIVLILIWELEISLLNVMYTSKDQISGF